MPESFLTHCKGALSNLISNKDVLQANDPYKAFSEALMNLHAHYCLDVHTSVWCFHEKVAIFQLMTTILLLLQVLENGDPFTSQYKFTCMAQVEGFMALLKEMSGRPQDYVSDHGRLTTNTVEGFHGLVSTTGSLYSLQHFLGICKRRKGKSAMSKRNSSWNQRGVLDVRLGSM